MRLARAEVGITDANKAYAGLICDKFTGTSEKLREILRTKFCMHVKVKLLGPHGCPAEMSKHAQPCDKAK
eukprot:12919851-Prorocentrum_lima.AAC.1